MQTAHALLYEIGGVLWSRTRGLPSKFKKAGFCVGQELIKRYVPKDGTYSNDEKQQIKYYMSGSYLSWQFVSCRQMLKVKLKNDYGIE